MVPEHLIVTLRAIGPSVMAEPNYPTASSFITASVTDLTRCSISGSTEQPLPPSHGIGLSAMEPGTSSSESWHSFIFDVSNRTSGKPRRFLLDRQSDPSR